MAKVKFQADQLEVSVPLGTEILTLHKLHPHLPLKFGCTRGDCGVCAIKIVEGEEHLSRCARKEAQTLAKKGLQESCRLACQCAILGDIVVAI